MENFAAADSGAILIRAQHWRVPSDGGHSHHFCSPPLPPPHMTPSRHAPALPRVALLFGAITLTGVLPSTTLRAQGAPATQPAARRARISGTIVDVVTKQPIQGVNVFVVGTPITASTGPDGRFIIPSAPPGVFPIEARRIGYAQQRRDNVRLIADSVITLNFEMSASATRLDEVTIAGTIDATSAAKSTISVEKLGTENIPVPPTSSAAGLLAGKVAGVAVTRNSGAPGAGVNIVLRTPISGITEGGGTPGPLFVVDGVFLNQGQSVTTQDIEAMDIESIEVIKGAAAASLYGSRAAAGVIAITTKRGRGLALGSNQFQIRGEAGTDQFLTRLDKNQYHAFRQDDQGNWLNANNEIVPRAQRALTQFGIMDQPFRGETYNHADLFFRPGGYKHPADPGAGQQRGDQLQHRLLAHDQPRHSPVERGVSAPDDPLERGLASQRKAERGRVGQSHARCAGRVGPVVQQLLSH